MYIKSFSRCAGHLVKKSYKKKAYIFEKISGFAGFMVKKSFVNKLKNEGDVMIKSDDFQRKHLSSVGRILGTQI